MIFKNLPVYSNLGDENVNGPKSLSADRNLKPNIKIHKDSRQTMPKSFVILDQLVRSEKELLEDTIVKTRREFVKNMTLHAWTGYKKYAWGKNELKPVSRVGHSAGIFGGQHAADNMGATIVDAMDTLYLMGFDKEFEAGQSWIMDHLNLNVDTEFSAFEVNIRFIGGLISLHSLTKNKVITNKKREKTKLF